MADPKYTEVDTNKNKQKIESAFPQILLLKYKFLLILYFFDDIQW